MGITQELAEWSVNYKYGDIPPKAIRLSKEHILDAVGVTFPGAKDAVGQTITRVVRRIGGEPQASVIGGGFKTSVTEAALANGTMIHALDYDDGVSPGHYSGCIVPVLLALGEWYGHTGKELLLAYTVGLEAFGKGQWGTRSTWLESRGFHPTPIYGVIGAAITAAKLMGFNTAQTQNTLGIVSSMAGGLVANFGTMTKPMHSGHAARSGVLAAIMTEEGYTGFPDVLEHVSGFAPAFFGHEGYDLGRWTRDLGNPLRITHRGPYIKKYACCGGNQTSIDAMLGLHKEYDFNFEDVDHVTVDVAPQTLLVLRYFKPENEYQAKFSLQYNVAAALVDKKHDLSTFEAKKIKSRQMAAAMKKVQLNILAEGDGARAPVEGRAVRVFLKDGRVLVKNTEARHGSYDYPLTRDEVIAKYLENAGYLLSKKNAVRVKDIIMDLENVKNVREMMTIVSSPK